VSKVVTRDCWFCGSSYGYMVSGYGVSPGEWNANRGVGYHYCSDCADRVTSWHRKVWRLEDDIDRNLKSIVHMLSNYERWLGFEKILDGLHVSKASPSLIHGIVSPEPMKKPVGGLLFHEYKYGEGSDV